MATNITKPEDIREGHYYARLQFDIGGTNRAGAWKVVEVYTSNRKNSKDFDVLGMGMRKSLKSFLAMGIEFGPMVAMPDADGFVV